MKILDVLNRENWIKGHPATDVHYNPVSPVSPHACRFCLFGAAIKAYGFAYVKIVMKLEAEVGNVGDWNDKHTWEDVEKLVKELGI